MRSKGTTYYKQVFLFNERGVIVSLLRKKITG